MKARLFCPAGNLKGASFEIDGSATIGRDAENSILLEDDQVSKRHARIWFDADLGSFRIEDLGSRNGTELDGVPLSGAERLGGLHVVSFAGHDFVFQRLADAPAEGVSDSTSIEREIPTLPLSLGEIAADTAEPAAMDQTRIDREVVIAPSHLVGEAPAEDEAEAAAPVPSDAVKSLFLVITNRGEPAPRYALAEGENDLGRSSRAAVSINAAELSRRHAALIVEGRRVWVEDKRSRNHTYCAGERVVDRVEVKPGVTLRFANIDAKVVEE